MLVFISSDWVEAMDPYSLKKFNIERRAGRSVVLITDLGDGRDRVVCATDKVAGDLGTLLSQAFTTGQSGIVQAAGRSFFLDVYVSIPSTGIDE